ncbi:MAG TPA: NAD(P)H-dependent oxidoreductase [Candidatus Binatia bacterium]|nr:NAD(P)H-dependent oxidoreductase [Candidatus Binatia bacterium]
MNNRHLSIPVILGTTRKGRMSAHAARFMVGQIEARNGITTELIDISTLPMPIDDAGESIKDPAFSEKMAMADGLVIVTPEYNHSFPGLLKTRLGQLPQGIHSQTRRYRRSLSRSVRRCQSNSGFLAGPP